MKVYSTVQENPPKFRGDELNKRKHSSFGMKLHTLVWGECYLILFLVFFLALLQGAFLKLNLVLLLVLAWATFRPPREVVLVAFASGLILDLALGRPLGLFALVFLLASYLLLLYRRRFDSLHPLFLPLFVFLTAYLLFLFDQRHWFGGSCLVLALLALGVRYLLVFLIGRVDQSQIKLR